MGYFRKDKNEGKWSHYLNAPTIRAEMVRNGYRYADMAEFLGIKTATFQAFINGNIEPSISRMIKTAEVLRMPINELFNFKVRN